MADEVNEQVRPTGEENYGEYSKSAINAANLTQALMAQIYDIFTTGGEVANPSEDNFFCWLTPGIAITPDQFEFATEGLTGIVRARTASQRKATQQNADPMSDLANQIMKNRVEEIANKKMTVETNDTQISAEDKKRAAELEAQKEKEKKQQNTNPNLAALSDAAGKKDNNNGYDSDDDSSNDKKEAEVQEAAASITESTEEKEDTIKYNNASSKVDESSIMNQETKDLTEEELEALKAERVSLLYMQAENFAYLVNIIPDVSGRKKDNNGEVSGMSVLENEGSLYDVYDMVLTQSQVIKYELDEKTKKNLEKARAFLTATVMKPKGGDIFSEEMEPCEVDSPQVEAYNEKMEAYINAYLEYNNKRLAALSGDNARAIHDWSLNGQLYYNRVRAAENAWISKGYKNEVDQCNAFIANVTEKDMSLLKQRYKETLQRSLMTGLVTATEFPFTTISPANFAAAPGWTEFTFNKQSYRDHIKSDVNNHSWRVDQTSRSIFHKQHYNYSKDNNFQELDMGFDLTNIEITFKIMQVNIVRPWFKPSFLISKGWRFDPGSVQGKQGTILSSGGFKPDGILPAYITSMLVVKDVVIDFKDYNIAKDFKHKFDQVKHDGGAGVSIGILGIGARANVSYLDNKKHDESEYDIDQYKSKITIPGMQIVGYRCHLLSQSPNPLPGDNEWA